MLDCSLVLVVALNVDPFCSVSQHTSVNSLISLTGLQRALCGCLQHVGCSAAAPHSSTSVLIVIKAGCRSFVKQKKEVKCEHSLIPVASTEAECLFCPNRLDRGLPLFGPFCIWTGSLVPADGILNWLWIRKRDFHRWHCVFADFTVSQLFSN